MRSPQEFDHTFPTMIDQGVGAAVMLDDAMFYNERARLVELAVKRQMPTIYGHRGYVEAGGLLSYGPNYSSCSEGRRPSWIRFSRAPRWESCPSNNP